MKNIILIILTCLSALALYIGVHGLVAMIVAVRVSQMAIVTVPFCIIGLTGSILLGGSSAMLRKHILSKISFFVSLAAFLCSLAAVIIWLAVL